MVNLGFLSRNISVAGHNIPILLPLLALGVGAFVLLKKPSGPMKVGVAPDVQFSLNPPQLTPNVPATLSGQFQDLMGKPVEIAQGYYYIFLVAPTGMKRLISQGSLGMNISRFNAPINTQGLQPPGMNKYNLVVTDVPLTQGELQ